MPQAQLSKLSWQHRFVDALPGDPEPKNFVRQVPRAAYSRTEPTPVREPKLIAWSSRLAEDLGLAQPTAQDIALLAGNVTEPGMIPYAARYVGHQFGSWAGQLGDGRAITLGEATTAAGTREFQLKGAGPTPYSRRADGRAVLRSSIREFLCSEAMHFLCVPTTRALSLISTGEPVVRDMFYDGHPQAEPGAIVCRVAPSFLRFGNFEILAARQEHELLKKLADWTRAEHFPGLDYATMIDEVARRTAALMVHWMRVGFVHGVMNTDNMSILGLTIDYGPYGWLEPYDANWTPNTTDAEGRRYRFGHQPGIALWNLTRLCESFDSLVPEDRLIQSLELYHREFKDRYDRMMAEKLGLKTPDPSLAEELTGLLQLAETDMTIFFRRLGDWTPETDGLALVRDAFYVPELPGDLQAQWRSWFKKYAALRTESRESMNRVNPKYVLRNYLAQNAIDAATAGDLKPLERLLRVLEHPYDEQPAEEDLFARRPDWARTKAGCSALSCSS